MSEPSKESPGTGRFELTSFPHGGGMQLRLMPANGEIIDVVFEDTDQFYRFVAGQHVDEAKVLVKRMEKEDEPSTSL
jgi:hypothetical protein